MARRSTRELAKDSRRTAHASRDVVDDLRAALPELARQAERVFHDNADRFRHQSRETADRLRSQSREAAEAASEQLDTARTYVVQRVQDRPFTTTMAVLGAGFLLGLLFAGRRR